MTQEEPKTMTARANITDPKEAWQALVDGKVVYTVVGNDHIKLESTRLLYLTVDGEWAVWPDGDLGRGPYQIVSDPSKPEVSEYDEERHNISVDDIPLLSFIEKWYVRKGDK